MSSVDVYEGAPSMPSSPFSTSSQQQTTLSTKIITTLSEEWGFLTGQASSRDNSAQSCSVIAPTATGGAASSVMLKQNGKVPLLMQDPLAVLLHFVLLLPVNIDTAYYITITRACYNMMLAQTLVRLCANSLTKKQREILTGQIAPTHRGSGGADKGNLPFYLRKIISYLETTKLLSDEEHEDVLFQGIKVPPSPRKEDDIGFDEDSIDLASLENEAQLCMLPFLRIASLVFHSYSTLIDK